jgi:CRP-like cAMP-binding protein
MKSDKEEIYGQIRIFRGIPASELKDAFSIIAAREASYEKNETLIDAGNVLREFFCLLRGCIQGVRYQIDGTADLVQIFTPGEIFGLDIVSSTTRICPFRLIASEACVGLHIEFDSLFSTRVPAATRDMFSRNVIQCLANDSIRRLHKIDVLYRRSLRARITVYLRHLAIMKASKSFLLDMNREQLAQYLGVNRSALSHELSEMRRAGLIDFRKEYFILLSDEFV